MSAWCFNNFRWGSLFCVCWCSAISSSSGKYSEHIEYSIRSEKKVLQTTMFYLFLGTGLHNAWHRSSNVFLCYPSLNQSTQLAARQQTWWWKHVDVSFLWSVQLPELSSCVWVFIHTAKTADGGSAEVEWGAGLWLGRLGNRHCTQTCLSPKVKSWYTVSRDTID